MMKVCIPILFSIIIVSGCASNTYINYFPDQRGPLYCRLNDKPSVESYKSNDYEVVQLPNWERAFALRKPSTNEFVILANSMVIKKARAEAIYEESWWRRRLAAVKLLVVVGIENEKDDLDRVREELAAKYPGAVITESVAADILIDIYSVWLGSEYIRAPCDGVALDSIPFEITLAPGDGSSFLKAKGQELQLAGRVLFRDAISGWRFHRSFSINRQDFEVTE